MIDIHLDATAKLVCVEIAGDRDHRRPVEPGVPDTGGQVGRARPQRCDPQPRRTGHPPHHIGGETGGTFMRGQHEWKIVRAHRLHQGQHVAAGNAESVCGAGFLQDLDD